MSGRLLTLVLILAVASAAVGAGAAFLLRATEDERAPDHEVRVVTTVQPGQSSQSAESVQQQAQQMAVRKATQVRTQPESTVRPPPANQANQTDPSNQADPEETTQSSEPTEAQAAQSEIEETPRQEQPERQSGETEDDGDEAEVADAEASDQVSVVPSVIVQGEAFALMVESLDAHAAAATVAGRSWDLSPVAAGEWWGIVAVPRDAELGVTDVLVDLYGEGGVWLRTIAQSIMVLANMAPFEEVVLGGTGTPADPAAVAYDIAVRFTEHTAVTGPPRWQGAWILPVEGEVTGVFGAQRSYDGVVAPGWHHGHDIAAQQGDPIVAPAHGTVVWTGELVLHGMGVIVDHGAGVYSGYWHMSLIAVRAGHEVAPGDWLGNIGTTGLSTGPHLHWEVIVRGIDVDPVQWLGDDRPPLAGTVEVSEGSEDTLQ